MSSSPTPAQRFEALTGGVLTTPTSELVKDAPKKTAKTSKKRKKRGEMEEIGSPEIPDTQKHTKPSIGNREKQTHRVLHHLFKFTSVRHSEWRDTTIWFIYELFNLSNINPSLSPSFTRDDGLYIFSGSAKVAYLHFAQQHFLIHAKADYTIWDAGIFGTVHTNGSRDWPRQWKTNSKEEVLKFLEYLSGLPHQSVEGDEASRTIPVWVQERVWERDCGKCVNCSSRVNLCFDHILPFIKGGSSEHPNNLQILCAKCNLEKATNFWPVKIT